MNTPFRVVQRRPDEVAVLVMGVDENGLGPVLGPLVTTAIGLSLARYQMNRHYALGRELGIDDSKATAAFGKMALAEGLALAALERLHGSVPGDVQALLELLLLDAPVQLQDRCPSASLPQCWSVPLTLPCFGGDIEAGRKALALLAKRGVELVHVKSAVACTKFLNERLISGQSRVEVDLELMERLMLDGRARLGDELYAVCGMVGGIRNYPDRMRHFRRDALRARKAARGDQPGTLAYDVDGVGQVRFEIDADQHHMPVALASMIGKYLRELWMLRHNRFYQASDPALLDVSGYHDPVTRRFIEASRVLRKRLGVDEACFVRDSAKQLIDRNQLSLFAEAE